MFNKYLTLLLFAMGVYFSSAETVVYGFLPEIGTTEAVFRGGNQTNEQQEEAPIQQEKDHTVQENPVVPVIEVEKEEKFVLVEDSDVDDFMIKKSLSIRIYEYLHQNKIKILKSVVVTSLVVGAACYGLFRLSQSQFFQEQVLQDHRAQYFFHQFGGFGEFIYDLIRLPYTLHKEMPDTEKILKEVQDELSTEAKESRREFVLEFAKDYLERRNQTKPGEDSGRNDRITDLLNQYANKLGQSFVETNDQACIDYIRQIFAQDDPEALIVFNLALENDPSAAGALARLTEERNEQKNQRGRM